MKSDYREAEKQHSAAGSVEKRDAKFRESTLRLFVEAIRANREIPDRDKIHRNFYKAAKIIKGMSEKGAKAGIVKLTKSSVAQSQEIAIGRHCEHDA